jgi:serine phosphatase RsbU (regulator of sigma subunit)/anti-sigma regulatory factor (Ser/Thr protein kinase)
MLSLTRTLRWVRGRRPEPSAASDSDIARVVGRAVRYAPEAEPIDIAPNDPLLAYVASAPGPVAIADLDLDSPAVSELRRTGVRLIVPLVSQGELIGMLNLGPRLSDQEYSRDDRALLDKLATQTAPALRVAQLVREQQAEILVREQLEQEMRVAQLIQQQFLPKRLPDLPGWQVAAFYRAARQVGGDFYDFIELPEGKVGLVIGDVTGHGVPAALVMATTRSFIRADAPRLVSPGAVLARVNDLLNGDIPPNMFVTCLYAVLDPATGRIRYANAGHDLPYVRTARGVIELRATGMPLGLMLDMTYEEKEAIVGRGESVLLHSDGVAEAHSRDREMFGFPRMRRLVAENPGGQKLIDVLLTTLQRFTGPAWEQEDDITLVTLTRSVGVIDDAVVDEFSVPSEQGNERLAMDRVATAVGALGLSAKRLERLKTAVAEAAMNAIEHGNQGRAELPVKVRVETVDGELHVSITDHGGGREIPEPTVPDLEAKLAGLQKPRGWGLFLIKNMVDDMRVSSDDRHHTVELVVKLKEATDGNDE